MGPRIKETKSLQVLLLLLLLLTLLLTCNGNINLLGVALAAVGPERNLTRNERQALTPGVCVLPKPLLHGQYRPSANRCRPEDDSPACVMTPGAYVPNNWVIFFKCDEGYVPNPTQPVTFCKNGSWEPALPFCKSELCAALGSFGVDIECAYGGQTVSCSEPMKPGTVATLDCQDGYRPALNSPSKQLICLDVGAWDYPPFYCIPGEVVTSPKPLLVTTLQPPAADHKTVKSQNLPGLDTCGLPKIRGIDWRIIYDRPSEPGEYPWIAIIGYTYTRKPTDVNLRWQCAGSLITDRYVITAAQCLHPSALINYIRHKYVKKVRLGEFDINLDRYGQAIPTDFDIEKITYHEDYVTFRKENDIGLIKLKDKVTYTDLIKPICLPTPEFQENLLVGYHPTIGGWRVPEFISSYSDTRLQVVEVEIEDTYSCMDAYGGMENITNDPMIICAASPGELSCKMIIGGPMMLRKKTNKTVSDHFGNFFLIGISLYPNVFHCPGTRSPRMFTRVSEYMDWILNNVDK